MSIEKNNTDVNKDTLRVAEIDMLRGVAILSMILIHTNVYFLQNRISYTGWNWAQFAVQAFIFCSSYIFFQKPFVYTLSSYISYVKKRFARLLLPYYIFLFVYIALTYMGDRGKLTSKFILESLTIVGGIDVTWMVLLFLILSCLLPLLHYFYHKKQIVFWITGAISFLSSIVFLYVHPSFSYKWIMWLPWLTIVFFSIIFSRATKSFSLLLFYIIISCLLFLISREVLIATHTSLRFFDNKYPPNLYILSYGALSISLLYIVSGVGKRWKTLHKGIRFFSQYSYSIFFVHYLVIYVLIVFFKFLTFNWVSFFMTVVIISILLQLVLNYIEKLTPQRRSTL
ncbi:MAG: acyltransferase [bacterium]|nr:acyltransferase [bacterium]